MRARALLLAWGFVAMSWIQGPFGSGGWHIVTVDGFAERGDCDSTAGWMREVGRSENRRVVTSECYPVGR